MKPTIVDVLPAVKALYARDGGGAGCCLHVILDDGNVRDAHVDGCIEDARKAGHSDCLALGLALRSMSRTQRKKLGGAKHGRG